MEYNKRNEAKTTCTNEGFKRGRASVNSQAREMTRTALDFEHKPSYSHLKSLVNKVLKSKTWWDLYGIDLAIAASTSILLLPLGFLLMRTSNIVLFPLGFLILAYLHYFYASKCAHMATHGSLGQSKLWNRCLGRLFSEVCGGFTFDGAEDIHIKAHHPYTNIVGLGDSSTWRAPFLNRVCYFFFAPLFLPLIAPLVSLNLLWGRWKAILAFIPNMAAGMFIHFFLLRKVSGFSFIGALICMFASRGLFSTLYVHINIFQHIGLAFYTLKNRPERLLQMATGVLNLHKNFFLDSCFGHSITTCHVEHHLFPHLSDNMCLMIKPLVSEYFKTYNLPYNEDYYSDRLKIFYHNYTELMVHAPPITEFVGIQ